MEQPTWLSNFIAVYEKLGTDNLAELQQIYADKVVFEDPMHRFDGLEALMAYFEDLYTHLKECDFKVVECFHSDNQAALYWRMSYVHPRLNKGKRVTVEGHTLIKGEGEQVVFHRDYLDIGAMLYEQVPLLGFLVKAIKKRAGKQAKSVAA